MITFGTQLPWMYASCVVYPLSQISKQLRWLLDLESHGADHRGSGGFRFWVVGCSGNLATRD